MNWSIKLIFGFLITLFVISVLNMLTFGKTEIKLRTWCRSFEGDVFYTDLITGKFERIDCRFPNNPRIIKDYHYYTTAICNDEKNFCLDVVIECNNNELLSITPIEIKGVQLGENWVDRRPPEVKYGFCNDMVDDIDEIGKNIKKR